MQSAEAKPAGEDCNDVTAASSWDASLSSGRRSSHLQESNTPASLTKAGSGSAGSNQQGAIACRDGQKPPHEECCPQQHAAPASANQLLASNQRLHLPDQSICFRLASSAAACNPVKQSNSAENAAQLAPSTAGLSSEGLPNLQEASQVMEAALSSGNEQRLAAGIYLAVRVLSVGSGAAAELPHTTRVGQQSFN